ncbi:PAS domain-containing sensor histidine kinase [Christiangramia salexigens]|nr:PAS domain-containing sensor histidine kinase [Christiangramia salexigens]
MHEKDRRIQELEEELLATRKELEKYSDSETINSDSNSNDEHLKKNFSKAIIENIHTPILVLDDELRVRFINKAFFNTFKVNREETAGRKIYDLGNKQWDIDELRDILENVLPKRNILSNFEVFHDFQEIGERCMLLNAREIDLNTREKYILLSIEDITSKKKAENKLKESEHRYREMIHSSPSLIAILRGPEHVVEIANDAIIKTWGKGPNVIGKPLLEVLPEMVDQRMGDLFDKVYQTGKPFYAHERPIIHEQNGKLVKGYFDFTYQPQRDSNGEVTGVAVIANDVTQQAELNNRIKESERKFRTLMNFMPHKINIADADGDSYFYNLSWLEFTERSMDELIRNPWTDWLHPEEKEQIQRTIDQSFKKGRDLEMEMRLRDKSGDYKWHLVRIIPLHDNEGKLINWITSSTEIQKLKEEEKRKGDFLKLVSHELKTPVTSAKGYVQLLQSMIKNSEDLQASNLPLEPYLLRIEDQIERLIRLIFEMLDLSRMEQNELELKKTNFSLNELVGSIIEDLAYSYQDVQIEVDHLCDCQIIADKDRIGQVIINFITNAIKYSNENKEVNVKVYEDDDRVAVSVKDHGIGIAKEDLNRIFKRFYRVAGKNEDTYSGFGIGLYLSNEIIERHNGEIIVNSSVGEGSEFIFTLPLNNYN